jgi:hypothetical protein
MFQLFDHNAFGRPGDISGTLLLLDYQTWLMVEKRLRVLSRELAMEESGKP